MTYPRWSSGIALALSSVLVAQSPVSAAPAFVARHSSVSGSDSGDFSDQALSGRVLNIPRSFYSKTATFWSAIGRWRDGGYRPNAWATPAGPFADLFYEADNQARSGHPSRRAAPADAWAERMNRHDGIDFISIVAALERYGILKQLREDGTVTVDDMLLHVREEHARANEGFWIKALDIIARQGWITLDYSHPTPIAKLTDTGLLATDPALIHAYAAADRFIRTDLQSVDQLDHFLTPITPQAAPGGNRLTFTQAVELSARQWDIPTTVDPFLRRRTLEHVDGLLVAMTGLMLNHRGAVERLKEGPANREDIRRQMRSALSVQERVAERASRLIGQVSGRHDDLDSALQLMVEKGWLEKDADQRFRLAPGGEQSFEQTMAAGVPLSYLPMFAQIDELLIGDPATVLAPSPDGRERHVSRTVNLIGTKAAHRKLFELMMPRLDVLFNATPIDQQPRLVVDIGSGDGSYLKAIYDHIVNHTERGKWMKADPTRYSLRMIGADYSPVARAMTEKTLRDAEVPHDVLFGDINDWESIAGKIRRLGYDPQQALYTTTYLIHNRPFLPLRRPPTLAALHETTYVSPDSRYADRGYRLTAAEVEQNLFEFFQNVKPFIGRFGLLTTELHGLPIDLSVKNIGRVSDTSYSATHAFSGQYIVPLPVFLQVAARAGIEVVYKELKSFDVGDGNAPNSILYLKVANAPVEHIENPAPSSVIERRRRRQAVDLFIHLLTRTFRGRGYLISAEDVAREMGIHAVQARYHLDRLEHVKIVKTYQIPKTVYGLDPAVRRVLQKGLLPAKARLPLKYFSQLLLETWHDHSFYLSLDTVPNRGLTIAGFLGAVNVLKKLGLVETVRRNPRPLEAPRYRLSAPVRVWLAQSS